MIRRSSTNEHWLAWADLVDKASSYHLKPASVFFWLKKWQAKMGQPYFWSYESHSSNLSIWCLKFIPQLSTTKICLFQSCICTLILVCFFMWAGMERSRRLWSHNTTFYVSRLFCLALESWSSPSERMSTLGMSLCVSSAFVCVTELRIDGFRIIARFLRAPNDAVYTNKPLICWA